MKIENNTVVQMNYVLTDSDGRQMDASNGEPMAYLHGHHNVIPGLEKALVGKTAGDSLTVTIPAAEAYGETQSNLIQEGVPKAMFKG